MTNTSTSSLDCGAAASHAPKTEVSNRPATAGLTAWIPTLVILIGLPLMALAVSKYVLLPGMKRAFVETGGLTGLAAAGGQDLAPCLARIPLQTTPAKGAHSGFRSLGLVGADTGLKAKVDQNKAKLMEVAAVDLRGTTVEDLDNSNALEAKRAQLRADFNHVLGAPLVKQVYIAEWPR